jgi:hypothetical protein
MRAEVKSNIPLAASFSRKHFETKIRKWKLCQERMEFILRRELATEQERINAERYLRTNGWSQEAVDAARRR